MLEICAELEGYGGMCSTFGGTIDGAVGGAVLILLVVLF